MIINATIKDHRYAHSTTRKKHTHMANSIWKQKVGMTRKCNNCKCKNYSCRHNKKYTEHKQTHDGQITILSRAINCYVISKMIRELERTGRTTPQHND